jgi:hypothetical protein
MSTYSINISTPTESTSYFLTGDLESGSNFKLLLDRLPDNLDKLINPRDLRDVMLSLQDSVIFKETSTSGMKYIGIDTGNPSDRDLKRKILLGKRSFSGTFSYTDPQTIHIMDGLTTQDSDLFIYNSKEDTQQQITTRMQLISGVNYSLNEQMPYIQSQVVSGLVESRSLDFINRLGDIDIRSNFSNISINSITFSSASDFLTQTTLSGSNNKVLVWNDLNSQLEFGDLIFPATSSLGTQSETLEIIGNPVNVNDYPLEFTDNRRSSYETGDISYGSQFTNVSIQEMLRRMIYDYLPPTSSVRILAPFELGIAEVGTFPGPVIEWTINKKTLPTLQTSLTNMIPGVYPPITNPEYETVVGQSNGVVISPIGTASTSFQVIVNDGVQSFTTSTSIRGIYPYFWGFSQLSSMTTIGLQFLEKSVLPFGDKEVQLFGSGNFYFIYSDEYPSLDDVLDENGDSIFSDFEPVSVSNFSSPTGLWSGHQFKVYKIENITKNTPVNWTFEY